MDKTKTGTPHPGFTHRPGLYAARAPGDVLIISPWNYLFTATLSLLSMALAAGNYAIQKPFKFTHRSSHLIARMVNELFSENKVAAFVGDKTVTIELLKKPFDHIYFTGETEGHGARHVSSITLELGGK